MENVDGVILSEELTVLFEVWLLLFSLDPAVGISLMCPSGM